MKRHIWGLLVLTLMVTGPSARAESGDAAEGGGATAEGGDFDALVSQAMERYQARDYEQAIELFQRAYEIQPEPELVYNIARSHERLAHREEALAAYERFIELPGTTGELRARALENIRALREEIAALEAARRAEQEVEAAERQAGSGQQAQPGGAGGPAAPPPPQETGSSALAVTGYALIGIGVAVLATGAVFGGLAISSYNQYQDAGFQVERLDLRDDVSRRALIADVLLFSGAGVAAAGVVMAVVAAIRARRGDGGTESARGVSPTIALGEGFGLGLSGRF